MLMLLTKLYFIYQRTHLVSPNAYHVWDKPNLSTYQNYYEKDKFHEMKDSKLL